MYIFAQTIKKCYMIFFKLRWVWVFHFLGGYHNTMNTSRMHLSFVLLQTRYRKVRFTNHTKIRHSYQIFVLTYCRLLLLYSEHFPAIKFNSLFLSNILSKLLVRMLIKCKQEKLMKFSGGGLHAGAQISAPQGYACYFLFTFHFTSL